MSALQTTLGYSFIDPMLDAVDAAIVDRESGPQRLGDLVDALVTGLSGHLKHEESEALALIDTTLAEQQWQRPGPAPGRTHRRRRPPLPAVAAGQHGPGQDRRRAQPDPRTAARRLSGRVAGQLRRTAPVGCGFLAAMLYDTVGPALLATLEPRQFESTLELKAGLIGSDRAAGRKVSARSGRPC